jgi:hypothetical protein
MPRVAVIQNGTDVARSSWADVVRCYQDSCGLLSGHGGDFTPEFVVDAAVGPLLDGLDRSDIACLVFATNALTSDQVVRAVAKRTERLHDFVRGGGGLVVLHQWLETLAPVVPDDRCPVLANRVGPAPAPGPVETRGRDDVLLHAPAHVDLERLRDGAHEHGPSWLFFKAFDLTRLPEGLTAVLVRDAEQAVLVRSDDHVGERMVLSTVLLDWQHNVELLANVIHFAAVGPPRRLIWREPHASSSELLHRWLSMDGAGLVRQLPATDEQLAPVDGWLLAERSSYVDTLVVPPDVLDAFARCPEVLAFLRRGGSVVTTDRVTELPASRVTALVGSYSERALAGRLHAELRAVAGWDNVESAFDLRNIVSAVALLEHDPANVTPASITLAELAPLAEEACERLAVPRHREDVSSSIALGQVVPLLLAGATLDASLVTWMKDSPLAREFDASLQVRAVVAAWAGIPDPFFLIDVAEALEARTEQLVSPAPVVRCLDSVGLLGQLELLGTDTSAGSVRLAMAATDLLGRFSPEPDAGWLSVEATADVVRGLVAVLDRLPEHHADLTARVARCVATGTDVLRRGLQRYERNPRGVAWRARVTHALVLSERRFPIGLQRLATLQWPESPVSVAPGGAADHTLVEHLGAQNSHLKDHVRALNEQGNAVQADLSSQRVAAMLGRGIATTLPTLVIVGVAGWIAVLVGATTFWGLMANLGVLASTVLTVLGLLYSALARLHLLAAPAQPLQAAAEKVAIPVISGLGGLRKG